MFTISFCLHSRFFSCALIIVKTPTFHLLRRHFLHCSTFNVELQLQSAGHRPSMHFILISEHSNFLSTLITATH